MNSTVHQDHRTLVVRIKATGVEDHTSSGTSIDAAVGVPMITMHERRLHGAAIAFEGANEVRDDSVEQNGYELIKIGSRTFRRNLQIEGMTQALGKECLPTVVPFYPLREVSGVRCGMEAKPAGRRAALLMKVGQAGGELVGVGQIIGQVSKLAQEEVDLGETRCLVLSVGDRPRSEVRKHRVDGLHRLELSPDHVPARLTRKDLDEEQLLGSIYQFDVDAACLGPETDAMGVGGQDSAAGGELYDSTR